MEPSIIIQNGLAKNIQTRLTTMQNKRHLNRKKIFSTRQNVEKIPQKSPFFIKNALNEVVVNGNDDYQYDENDENHLAGNWINILDSAMELQLNLSELSELIIRAFRFQLLLIVCESFISITFDTYYMVSVAFNSVEFKLPTNEVVLFLLHHLFQPMNNMIVLVLSFRMVYNSFIRIQKVVNKLILYTKDDQLRTRLFHFSQQIQTNIPKFTIYGFFVIDGSLLYTMVAATTTYSIILTKYTPEEANANNYTSNKSAIL